VSRFLFIISFTFLLSACGGGGNSSNNSSSTTIDVTGTLVVPESGARVSSRAVAINNAKLTGRLSAAPACPNVPTGYTPLQSTQVDFIDASGNILETATTDDCGLFNASVPEDVVQAKAVSSNNRDIVADINVFTNANSNVVSTIPTAASYQIASIQSVSTNEIAFAVTDTVTNKAVIGIPDSAFEINVNNQATTINSLQSSAATSDTASVSLILDASGSMSTQARDDEGNTITDGNGVAYSRTRLTALASHTFLDNVAAGDETSVVIFASNVHFVDDALLSTINLTDLSGNALSPYTFSTDGFSSVPSQLRFIIDAYNDDSKLFGDFRLDDRHPETPEVLITSFPPWFGSTALYDAISTGIDKTSARTNTRKIVIAMSDGLNNASAKSINDVISEANTANIPVYTISYEAGDVVAMERIADETNATSFVVSGSDLSGAFQSIQTGITFQYIAGFANNTQAGDVVTLKLNINGSSVERSFTR